MYHAVVRRRVRNLFESLGSGDVEAATADVADEITHIFSGDHPLGGERHSRAAMQRWFERVFRLYPELEFEVQRVVAKGWPWDTWVAVQWSDRGRAADGVPYVNHGAHWIRLRWGKAVYIHAYLDTKVVEDSCARMAAAGIDEAAAPPITS